MIDTDALIRQINIDLITDRPNPIIEWFNVLWDQLYIIETDVYHNNGGEFIYFQIIDEQKKMIFYQDNNNSKFWCNHNQYWSILTSKFNIGYVTIQSLTKVLVENALTNNVIETAHPSFISPVVLNKINDVLYNTIADPDAVNVHIKERLGEAFENFISKPHSVVYSPGVRLAKAVDNIPIANPLSQPVYPFTQADNALAKIPMPYQVTQTNRVDTVLENLE